MFGKLMRGGTNVVIAENDSGRIHGHLNAVEKKVIFGIKIHPHVQILEMLILIIA